MFCCVRTRGRKEDSSVDRPSLPPQPPAGSFDGKKGMSVTGGGIRDGNLIVLAGAGVAVGATAAVVVNNGTGGGGGACGGVAGVGEPSGGGGTNHGCFSSGGSCGCGCGGGCGGCGGCGGG